MKLEPNLDVTLNIYWVIYNLGGGACQCTGDSKHKTSRVYFSCIYTLSFLLDVTALKCFGLNF